MSATVWRISEFGKCSEQIMLFLNDSLIWPQSNTPSWILMFLCDKLLELWRRWSILLQFISIKTYVVMFSPFLLFCPTQADSQHPTGTKVVFVIFFYVEWVIEQCCKSIQCCHAPCSGISCNLALQVWLSLTNHLSGDWWGSCWGFVHLWSEHLHYITYI